MHRHEVEAGALGRALALTFVVLAVELAGGLAAHSLALLSDAGHVLTDILALALAWLAVRQARRPADDHRTFGYGRTGILAALFNAAALIAIGIGILYEAVQRVMHPVAVHGGIVVGAALAAIAVNAYIGLGLRRLDGDLNVRAALVHVVSDLLAAVGVVVAGLVMLFTGWPYADPLVSAGIAVLIGAGAYSLASETVNVLLEGTPRGLSLDQVGGVIEETEGVISMHDLHVWSLGSSDLMLTCHVVVGEVTGSERLVRALEQDLCSRFGIGHTTIQVEADELCPDGLTHRSGEHNHPHRDSTAG